MFRVQIATTMKVQLIEVRSSISNEWNFFPIFIQFCLSILFEKTNRFALNTFEKKKKGKMIEIIIIDPRGIHLDFEKHQIDTIYVLRMVEG